MKEEIELTDEFPSDTVECKNNETTSVSDKKESPVSVRPEPVIRKPTSDTKSNSKSEAANKKKSWAPGSHGASAFRPYYKPPTLLTNLQRGNTQTELPLPGTNDITFFMLAGQGELTPENIISETIDNQDENGLTALMWAAGYGQLSSAKLLLQAGADTNCKGSQGQTALHLAAAYGHHDLVKLLLNHGADPNITEEEGNTPLIYGAQGDHPHVCYELLTRGADVTITNENNLNPYKAATLKNASTAKAVIENYLVQTIVNSPPDIFEE